MRPARKNPHTGCPNDLQLRVRRVPPWLGAPANAGFSKIGLVVIMTAAASVTFFRPEFGDFLYAPLAAGQHESHLTVLSALSRLGLDPWKEAAELSALSKDMAATRLASLITQVPGGSWTNTDVNGIAHRLIGLLPNSRIANGARNAKPVHAQGIRVSTAMLICIALGLAAAVIATNVSRSMQTSDVDASERATADVPQTLSR
jgi:hypothetical protein